MLAKQLYFTGDELVLIVLSEHNIFSFLLDLNVSVLLEDIKVFNTLIAPFLSIMIVRCSNLTTFGYSGLTMIK